MSNDITEANVQQPMGDAAAVIEKKARQLVYDSRYEVKGKLRGKRVDPATIERLVLQQISKSKGIPAVIARAKQMVTKKRGPVKEDFILDIQETATDNIANALFKVFVEGLETPEIQNPYLEEMDSSGERKYKIRVTDPKTGNSYVRYATREKISQLRAQGLKVELTEHGEPREGERKRGEDTARAKKAGKLDPVGKEDADVDNDGKPNDPNDKYIMKRRAAIGKAIAMRKEELDPVGQEDGDVDNDGDEDKSDKYLKKRRKAISKSIETRKEDYLWTEAKAKNEKTSGTAGVDNYASGAIKIFPKEDDTRNGVTSVNAGFEAEGPVLTEKSVSKAQQKFFGMVRATQKGEMEAPSAEVAAAAKSMKKKAVKDFASTEHEGLPEKKKSKKKKRKVNEAVAVAVEVKKERDGRADRAFRDVLKNKLRSAMGVKNPIIMVDPEELESTYNKMATKSNAKIEDGMCEAVGGSVKMKPGSGLGGGVPSYPAGQEPKPTGATLPPIKAAKKNLMNPLQVAHFEPTGATISEREFDEPGEEDWRPDVKAHNKKYGGYKPIRKPKPGSPGSGPVKPA